MTAIVGAFHRDGMAVSHAVAERMMGALSHHGPDGSGSWREGPVLMGLQRLAVAEGQPLAPTEQRHARGPVVVVADVRLDNREELAVALDRPVGSSDEELLLHAWLRWGEACPGRLLGDFAFAVWDGRDGRLFCARDPIGVRALHYHLATGVFLFATEIKALRAHGAVSDELDEGRIADHLGRIFADRTRTFFRDVRRLPPGHAMCVTAEAARRWCYWSLDPALRTELSDDDEYAERFLELLTQAVRCRMRTSSRLAVLLSGGLDSSALVGLAREKRGEWGHSPLTVLAARFPGFPAIDEGDFIEEVVAGGHVEPHFASASASTPLGDLERVLEQQDQPWGLPNLFVHRALGFRARELGARVILDGVDGDTTVGHGLEWVGELLRQGRVRRAVRECRHLARRFRRRTLPFLWYFGVRFGFVLPAWHRIAAVLRREVPRPPRTASRDFVDRVRWNARLRALDGMDLRPATTLREVHWRALNSDVVPHFLEVDGRANAAFGLEARHPYFDRRLVEFCYGTPPDQKLCDGWDRVVQRRALRGVLPERIRLRVTKSEWGDHFRHCFLSGDSDRIRSVVERPGRLEAYVDPRALAAAWRRCERGVGSAEDVMDLWLAVSLGLWLEHEAGHSRGGASPGARAE